MSCASLDASRKNELNKDVAVNEKDMSKPLFIPTKASLNSKDVVDYEDVRRAGR